MIPPIFPSPFQRTMSFQFQSFTKRVTFAPDQGRRGRMDRETGNKNLSQKLFLSLTFHNSSASVLSPFVCSPSLPLPHSSKRSKRPHPPAEGGREMQLFGRSPRHFQARMNFPNAECNIVLFWKAL